LYFAYLSETLKNGKSLLLRESFITENNLAIKTKNTRRHGTEA